MDERVAIFAPNGRDGAVMAKILGSAGIPNESVDPNRLVAGTSQMCFAAVLLTEEALGHVMMADLRSSLAEQPVWSDLPFILLIARGRSGHSAATRFDVLGNVTQIERPVHPATLVGTVRAALRARQRQLDAQRYIEEREHAERSLRDLTSSLEHEVANRTAALATTNTNLSKEMEERIKAEAEVRQLQANMIHLSRVSAMGTMASTIAHELNQPLSAAVNYLRGSKRLIEREAPTFSPMIVEGIDAAAASTLRAGEIVRHLRELVSGREATRHPENLPNLIEEALRIGMVDATEHGVTCVLALDPAAITVLVDRIQIQQVLINLIRNAIDSMHESLYREIAISTRICDENLVAVSVGDCGPGIEATVLPSLFSPFSTTKSDGMGIGLSISRTIIEAHGGTITGKNLPEGGAEFIFTIPTV